MKKLEIQILKMQQQQNNQYQNIQGRFEVCALDNIHNFENNRTQAIRDYGQSNKAYSIFGNPISCLQKSQFSVKIEKMTNELNENINNSLKLLYIGFILIFDQNYEQYQFIKNQQNKKEGLIDSLGYNIAGIAQIKNSYHFDNTGQFFQDGEKGLQTCEKFYEGDVVTCCIDVFQKVFEIKINNKLVKGTSRINPVKFKNCKIMDYIPIITTNNLCDRVQLI